MTAQERESALWASLERVADKEKRRELLTAGRTYQIKARVRAQVDGQDVSLAFEGQTAVGHSETRLKSSAPPPGLVVAWLLSRFGPRQREKLVEELVAEFGRRAGFPPLADELVALADSLLKRLRCSEQAERKGAVSTSYKCAT